MAASVRMPPNKPSAAGSKRSRDKDGTDINNVTVINGIIEGMRDAEGTEGEGMMWGEGKEDGPRSMMNVLKSVFKHERFRSDLQQQAVECAVKGS